MKGFMIRRLSGLALVALAIMEMSTSGVVPAAQENKSSRAQPADQKPVDQKPVDQKPGENKPG